MLSCSEGRRTEGWYWYSVLTLSIIQVEFTNKGVARLGVLAYRKAVCVSPDNSLYLLDLSAAYFRSVWGLRFERVVRFGDVTGLLK